MPKQSSLLPGKGAEQPSLGSLIVRTPLGLFRLGRYSKGQRYFFLLTELLGCCLLVHTRWRTPALFCLPVKYLLFTPPGCAPRAWPQRLADALLKVFCGQSCSFWSHGKTWSRSDEARWCTLLCFTQFAFGFVPGFTGKRSPSGSLYPQKSFPSRSHISLWRLSFSVSTWQSKMGSLLQFP